MGGGHLVRARVVFVLCSLMVVVPGCWWHSSRVVMQDGFELQHCPCLCAVALLALGLASGSGVCVCAGARVKAASAQPMGEKTI